MSIAWRYRRGVGIAAGMAERIEFEAAIAFRGSVLRCERDLVAVRAGAVPGIGVGRQAIVQPAAQKVVDRAVEAFADDVPQRDLDRGDAGIEDRPAARELVAEHFEPELFDLKRRLADDDAARQLLDDGFDRLRLEFAGAFADAADAVVCEDMGEDPVAPFRVDDVGVDACDAAILAAVDDHAAASLRAVPEPPIRFSQPSS